MKSVKELLSEHGLNPNKALGQNFLSDGAAIERIAALASEPGLPIIEIGPGLGAITLPLAETGLPLAAIELDRALCGVLEGLLPANASVVNADVLKADLEGIAERLGGEITVCGNLPYYITSPTVMRLVSSKLPIRRMVLMMQKEAADRFFAEPGSKNYGPLTVLSRLRYEIRTALELSPASYFPQPEVSSSVLVFDRNGAETPEGLETLLKCAFRMRRKTLANNLSGMGLARTDAAELINRAGLAPSVRAEALSPENFVRLCGLLPR